MTRKVTNKLLELIEDGMIDPLHVLKSCLCYMSEDDVADMAHCNELILDEEEEEEEEEKQET